MSDILCPVQLVMAPPTPVLLTLTAAGLCMLKVIFLPELYSDTKLTTLYLTLASGVFFVWGVWCIVIYPNCKSSLRHLPQPKSGTLFGIGFPSVLLKRPNGNLFLKLLTDIPNDGLIRFPGVFNSDYLLLTSPSSLAEVLVHKSYDFEKPKELRKFLRIILGDGLILVEGDVHKFQRKHVSPAFSFRHIKELIPIFWQKAWDMTGRVAAEIHENPEPVVDETNRNRSGVVEINHWANKVTMDIIGVAGLGRDFNSLYNADDPLVANYEQILEPTAEKALFFGANMIFPPRLIAKLPWKLNQTLSGTMETLRGVCRQLLQDKKDLMKADKEQPINILSLLIKSNNFDDEMLIDQLLTFLAAGHETTSSAFTWATHLLAINPQIQARLRHEIRTNLPSPSIAWDSTTDIASTLESLPYLHGVCSEVLRLFPTVPSTIRIAVRDTTINSVPIPKGTRIFITPWGINRSPHLWGDTAADFIPERWIDADTGKANNTGGVTSNYSNLTFLHGPRSCIGEKFARSELKALVAVFCGTFDIGMADPNEVPIPAGVITTKPKNGMKLRLQVVDGW